MKKPINIKNKNVLLVYPSEITVSIDIQGKGAPIVISGLPKISIQKFENINFNTLMFDDVLKGFGWIGLAFLCKNLISMNMRESKGYKVLVRECSKMYLYVLPKTFCI